MRQHINELKAQGVLPSRLYAPAPPSPPAARLVAQPKSSTHAKRHNRNQYRRYLDEQLAEEEGMLQRSLKLNEQIQTDERRLKQDVAELKVLRDDFLEEL